MKSLTAKTIARILIVNGFVLVRQRGSHAIFKNVESGSMVVVPMHGGNKPIPLGTFMAIVKQSKIPKDKFKLG